MLKISIPFTKKVSLSVFSVNVREGDYKELREELRLPVMEAVGEMADGLARGGGENAPAR